MAAKLNTILFGKIMKKMLHYEGAGVVRNGKLGEGGVRGGKKEKKKFFVISPNETGDSAY
jgi:hypothetical protein